MLEVLRAQPGDTILVRTRLRITVDQAKRLREQLASEFPGNKILIVSEEIDLEPIRTVEAKALVEEIRRRHDVAETSCTRAPGGENPAKSDDP